MSKLTVIVSALIPFLGRTAIGWIVDVTTLGATIIYGLISHAVYRHAQRQGRRLERCTGIAGVALMALFMLLLLIPGLLPFHAMETESYFLFIVWSVLGLAYYRILLHREGNRHRGQSAAGSSLPSLPLQMFSLIIQQNASYAYSGISPRSG